ncbi:hypothetical protein KJ618_02500 [Patescibacteria group bacterium]|nr:hypothetical protein [Patescibacteria group bacterium]
MKNKIAAVLFLCIVSVFPLLDLLNAGLPFGHDTPDHVARIANFYQSLSEGNIIPRWAEKLNWGYGHPVLMFLYPLPSYLTSFIHTLGFSFVDSTKLTLAIAYVASVIAMYLWASAAFNKRVGIVSAILYGFAPYRFIDLYVRGAIGEHVAFVFPPLVLYFLRKRSFFGASLSLAALILSHNAMAIMFLPIIGLYGLYLLFFEEKRKMLFTIHYSLFTILGFALSAFFWAPAFFEGKYTLRDIVTAGEFSDRFVPLTRFFYSPWTYGGSNEFSKSLGIAQWMGIVAAVGAMWRAKEKALKWFVCGGLLLLAGSIFFMTSWSFGIWNTFSILQKFQFPWRLLSAAVFIAAIVGAMGLDFILGKIKRNRVFVYVGLVLFVILTTIPMWKAKSYSLKPESYYTGVYDSTTDTGESSPIWSVRFMEHRPLSPLEIIEGQAEIAVLERTSTIHGYNISVSQRARFVENTLYFPGWNIWANNVASDIQFQDPSYRGLMTFWLEPGNYTVRAEFGETKLRHVANIIGAIGVLVTGILLLFPLCRRRKKPYQ